jgi:hypothetical protein
MTCHAKALAASVVAILAIVPVDASGERDGEFDAPILAPAFTRTGQWRTRIQQVFDPASHELFRRMYTIWDPEPWRDLDFSWTPDNPPLDKPGRIDGSGHLVWRLRDKPSYDRASVYAEYRGSVRNGRIEGYGIFLDQSGLFYQGQWRSGRMHGRGTLKLPLGDEYIGEFRAGRADGHGRYIDVTGEVYDGAFADGRRHGRGTTKLPNGRTYVSFWSHGVETESSLVLRLAQASGMNLDGPAQDVRIGITVDKKIRHPETSLGRRDDGGDLLYTVSIAPEGFAIKPDNPRLISMWKEGRDPQLTRDETLGAPNEYGVLSFNPRQLVPLTLVLQMQNRSASAIKSAGIYLDVKRSVSDLQPAVQMRFDPIEECTSNPIYDVILRTENFGWGPAEDAKLDISLSGSSSAGPAVTKQLGRLERMLNVDLEPDLKSAGVDTEFVRDAVKSRGFICQAGIPRQCLDELRQSGKFGPLVDALSLQDTNIIAKVPSKLTYGWHDVEGSAKMSSSTFQLTIPLGHLKTRPECGEGGQRESITTKVQELKVDSSNYRVSLSYQGFVLAGRTSQLTLPIAAPKSSEHEFTVVLQLVDGQEVRSLPINLLYYVPSWFHNSGN